MSRRSRFEKTLISFIKEVTVEPLQGAEIGVWRGETTAALLTAFPRCRLLCVDPWKAWEEGSSYYDSHAKDRISLTEWEKIYVEAGSRIRPFGKQATIMRATSEQAASHTVRSSMDFVFIDADHTYEHVKQDIELWLPKVRKGGLLCGHDYKGVNDKKGIWGVSKAVHEIFSKDRIINPGWRIWGVVV